MVLFELLRTVEARRRSSASDDTCGGARTPRSVMSGERGFTLIELMFASVYLAVGLLAIAAMEDIAISRSTDAKRLTVATNLAAEMLERVRFNSPANSTLFSGAYPYNGIRACSNLAVCSGGETPGNATATANLTANGDYDQWRARLKATDSSGALMLPNAVATVTSAATGTASLGQVLVTVQVQWSSGLRTPTITMNTIVAPL